MGWLERSKERVIRIRGSMCKCYTYLCVGGVFLIKGLRGKKRSGGDRGVRVENG